MLILALGHADSLPQDLGIMPGLLGRSLTARHPLCQKRNRLVLCRILGVVIKLPFDQPGHAVTRGRIQQTPQIVPTTVLRHQCHHRGDVLGKLLRQRHHAGTEQPALTQATTDITSIKEPFHCHQLVLEEHLSEALRDVVLAGATERCHSEIEIQESLAGSAEADCTVLGDRDIALVIQRALDPIHKVTHYLLPPILRYPGHTFYLLLLFMPREMERQVGLEPTNGSLASLNIAVSGTPRFAL